MKMVFLVPRYIPGTVPEEYRLVRETPLRDEDELRVDKKKKKNTNGKNNPSMTNK